MRRLGSISCVPFAVAAGVCFLMAPAARSNDVTDAAQACEHSQYLDEVIKGCTLLIEVLPNEAKAFPLTKRGNAYADKKEYAKAIDDYAQSIAIDPSKKEGYLNRGIAYVQSGAVAQALNDFRKVIEIDPGFAEAYYLRGVAYDMLFYSPEAIADFERAVALAPNEPRYKSALDAMRARAAAPAPAAPQTGSPAPQAAPPPAQPATPAAPSPAPGGGGGGPGLNLL